MYGVFIQLQKNAFSTHQQCRCAADIRTPLCSLWDESKEKRMVRRSRRGVRKGVMREE
jgi:hypothetical protein